MSFQIRRIAAITIVILIPTLVTLFLLTFHVGTNLYVQSPHWNDEIFYWREIQTFKEVGFNGGYYTYDEVPAAAQFSHFSAHGPWIAVLVGLISRVTGWYLYSMPFLSLIAITAALIVLMRVLRPDTSQLLLIGLLLLTFWPMLLYIPTTMVEGLNQAIAIIMASIFYAQLSSEEPLPRRWQIICLLFIGAISLLRGLWAFMFLPFLLLNSRKPSYLRLLLTGSLSIALIGFMTWLTYYGAAPFSANIMAQFAAAIPQSRTFGLSVLVKHFLNNVRQIPQGNPTEIMQRIQILAILVICLIGEFTFISWVKNRQWVRLSVPLKGFELHFHLLNLVPILLLNMVLNDIFEWRDFRALAPQLLLTLLILIAFKRLRLAGLFIVGNVLVVSAFLTVYRDNAQLHFFDNRQSLNSFAASTQNYLSYQADAPTSWCNTVLSPSFEFDFLALPPGLGFSVGVDAAKTSFRSRYLLLDETTYQVLRNRPNLKYLTDVGTKHLLFNQDVDCEPKPAS
jgi:hypothetical protein